MAFPEPPFEQFAEVARQEYRLGDPAAGGTPRRPGLVTLILSRLLRRRPAAGTDTEAPPPEV